jgi:uncharacterized protein (TIGR03435 family)
MTRRLMSVTAGIVGLIAVAVSVDAQVGRDAQRPGTEPRFEVVSIKPTAPDVQGGGFRISPGGRLVWINTSPNGLVAAAYQRHPWDTRDIIGGPPWFSTARFDVIAQATGGLPPVDADGFPSRLLAMLRGTLEERFALTAHWEKQERPIYSLVLARPDRRLGPQLVPVSVDCTAVAAAIFSGKPPSPRPGRGQECNLSLTPDPGSIQANAISIGVLARVLGPSGAGREVIDRTGLTGTYDVDLLYMPELPGGGISVDRLARDPMFEGRSGLFTALQEQLGLKLEAGRGQVDVLVIDHVERPSED